MDNGSDRELLELILNQVGKLTNELIEFRTGTNERFDDVEKRFDGLGNEIRRVGNQVAILENDHGKKLDALMDGYKQLAEGQEEIKAQITDLTSRVEKQEVEITVIKGGKAKNISKI